MAGKAKSKRWFSKLCFLTFKLSLIFIALIFVCAIYLDVQIRHRIDGQVWKLPAAIYGRMINLEPGMPYNQQDMLALLDAMQYRVVLVPVRSGEYSTQGNSIELIRRAFDFPDSNENEIHARLEFSNDRLSRISNVRTGREFGFFRLDPKLITMMQSPNGEQRLFVEYQKFPGSQIRLLLATEDRHFRNHFGVNPLAIVRAMLANLAAGRTVQGGSTLTQQLVKNLFLTNERSWSRKIKEAGMALVLELRYPKDRILELYLNEVYLGQSGKGGRGGDEIRGFPLASIYYFGRPISELSLDQQAMLVAMVRGANLYNPWRKPDLVMDRRNLVLKLAFDQQHISYQEYKQAIEQPLNLQKEGVIIAPQPAFIQLVLKELHEKMGKKVSELSGVKIFTTLDPVAQRVAEKAVETGIAELEKNKKIKDLEAAMIIIDRFSGEVRAVVGGAVPQYAGFNRALNGRRPIGSLAKPPVYLSALSVPEQYQLNTWLADAPITIPVAGNKSWEPRNFDRKFRGRVMIVDALAKSLNVPTVNLGMTHGLDNVAKTLEQLGIDNNRIEKVPAMLLGSTSLTPIEVAQIYQTIGSGGHRASLSSLRSIMDEEGRRLYDSYPESRLVLSPQSTYLTLFAMQQTIENGTARSLKARFGQFRLAAKTGSTNDLRDSWFVGIDGKEVAVIWVGRDNNTAINLTGAAGALLIYRHYLDNKTPLALTLKMPEGVSMMSIDKDGFFTCDKTAHSLPAIINDRNAFCSMLQLTKDSNDEELNKEQPITDEGEEDELSLWLQNFADQ